MQLEKLSKAWAPTVTFQRIFKIASSVTDDLLQVEHSSRVHVKQFSTVKCLISQVDGLRLLVLQEHDVVSSTSNFEEQHQTCIFRFFLYLL